MIPDSALRLAGFLNEKNLELAEKISKGWSSEIFLVKNRKGKKFAAKVEKQKSQRKRMVEKEAANLKAANRIGIGPKLICFDCEKRIVLMEFIEGIPFSKWLFQNPQKKHLQKCLDSLLEQAKKLDEIGLSHGQLAGRGANILVKKNFLPIIIDFEKASQARKSKNFNQLQAFLFRNPKGSVAKKIREILEN
ncbi:MAG: hypothetical protein PHD95_01450 [Candidatus ainarchaeum sp.]|nr:hypothetical protein [Candidatus ainarchaeum sp.]